MLIVALKLKLVMEEEFLHSIKKEKIIFFLYDKSLVPYFQYHLLNTMILIFISPITIYVMIQLQSQ